MRTNSMSVVDGEPKACGIDNFRIAVLELISRHSSVRTSPLRRPQT